MSQRPKVRRRLRGRAQLVTRIAAARAAGWAASDLLYVAGAVAVTVAGALVDPALGWAAGGLSCAAMGVMLEDGDGDA